MDDIIVTTTTEYRIPRDYAFATVEEQREATKYTVMNSIHWVTILKAQETDSRFEVE